MSIFSKAWDTLTGSFVKEIGDAIDKNVTNDEERMVLKNKFAAALQQFRIAIQEQVSERWRADMSSDSWLSKNIRPGVLIVITAALIIVIIASLFIPIQANIVNTIGWAFGIVGGAYFGGREIGKGIVNWKGRKN